MMSSVDPLRIIIILLHNTTDKSRVSPDKEQSKDKLMTNVFTELLIISPKRVSLNQKDLFITELSRKISEVPCCWRSYFSLNSENNICSSVDKMDH